MLRLRATLRKMVLVGALCLPMLQGTGQAEPLPLGEADKPDTEQPKEKKAVTVPAGTAMMVKTASQVSSDDAPGRRFTATLEGNLLAGDVVVAKAGSQVYGQVMSAKEIGRGIVVQHSDLVLALTNINIDGNMYPIETGSFSAKSTGVILKRRGVVIPAGSLLEFRLSQALTVKQ